VNDYESLSHLVWDCKYHLVWIPKCRKKVLYMANSACIWVKFLGNWPGRRRVGWSRGILCLTTCTCSSPSLSIPPKYAVASVVGFVKGKSAIHIARNFMGRRRNFVGQNFWARGYFVSTVGLDEALVRNCQTVNAGGY